MGGFSLILSSKEHKHPNYSQVFALITDWEAISSTDESPILKGIFQATAIRK